MKKIYFLFSGMLILSSVIFSQTKNITGIWEGKLNAGSVDLRMVFHYTKNVDGSYSATFDSPDQNVKGVPCSNVAINSDSVITEIKVARVFFRALLTNDSTMDGVWLQGPAALPLSLKHVQEVAQLIRPQTPKPPFDYNVDSVEYDNADKSVHFAGTFTYPKTGGPFITLLMITGSGQQDRDETIFEHHPFAVIADYLTKKGYAVLRVDDRNMGRSKGDLKTATSADFANDALTSFNYLLQRKEVNKNKIGLIGHSEGGLIAPMVYTRNNKVAFIISLAGTGVSGEKILLNQQTEPVKNIFPDTTYKAVYALDKGTLKIIHDNAKFSDSSILEKIKTFYISWKRSTSQAVLDSLDAANTTPETYALQVKQELKPWLKYFIATDPSLFWSNVKCPVLALDGDKDIQVYANENIPAIATALQQAGNKNVTTKIFPGLNHLFQHCITCTTKEYGDLTETFAPAALQTIGDWLDNTIKK